MIFDNTKFDKSEVNDVVNLNYTDDGVYVDKCGVDKKVLKDVEDYRNKYIQEATELAANKAKEIMEKDKKINKVIVDFPFTTSSKGSVNVSVDRSKTFPGINGGEEVTKSKITINVTDPNNKVSKPVVKNLESMLTDVLIK